MKRIQIIAGSVNAKAELYETNTAQAIWDALPITSRVNTWGDEIYFSIPVKLGEEDGRKVVEMGDLGYWPSGNGFCIFFGPTPTSSAGEILPASAVNVFGKINGDAAVFKKVSDGENIQIEKLE